MLVIPASREKRQEDWSYYFQVITDNYVKLCTPSAEMSRLTFLTFRDVRTFDEGLVTKLCFQIYGRRSNCRSNVILFLKIVFVVDLAVFSFQIYEGECCGFSVVICMLFKRFDRRNTVRIVCISKHSMAAISETNGNIETLFNIALSKVT